MVQTNPMERFVGKFIAIRLPFFDGVEVHHVNVGGVAPQTLVVGDTVLRSGREVTHVVPTRGKHVAVNLRLLFIGRNT